MAMNRRHLSTQKLRRETITLLPLRPPRSDEEKEDDSLQSRENHSLKEPENGGDSDGSSYSSDGEQDEFIAVQLAEIQKEVQCPICLGIIRKTRTVMECLHRFCRECIDKAMRLGNNECPACRTHCASRRSLRDDPNFDALIAALYPDIEKYEEEELAFHEEEKARNKLIQDSIAQAFCRQAEVSGKKRSSAKPKKQGSYRNMKGPRNYRDGSDEEEVAHGHTGSRDSSSSDDHCAEVKSKRYKLLGAAATSQPPSGANADDSGMNRELLGASVSLGSTEFLAWGGGGLRSNTRHGGSSSTNNRPSDSNRVARLIEHLQGGEERDKKNFKIHPLLVTLDEKSIPILEKRYFICNPKWTVGFLCQEVAKKTSVEASKIEMLIVKDYHPVFKNMQRQLDPGFVNPSEYELQLLDEHLTMQEVLMTFCERNLVLGYRLKAKDEGK